MNEELQKAFEAFHAENPEVYRLFSRFSFDAASAGHRHYSADAIMHRVRWHTGVETTNHAFKINNNLVAYYARHFMNRNPHMRGFFHTRQSPGAVPAAA